MISGPPVQLPPVTAIVPTHDRPELMARAVTSILEQRYDGVIEVIVVFDACDVVLPTVAMPANRTLRGLANERARGLAGARNTGILAASHELVAFLDDDDRWEPTKLAEQVRALERQPEAVLAGTAMFVDDGRAHRPRLVPVTPVTHEALLRNRLAALHSSSFLVRRPALLGSLGLVDETLPRSYGEDYDLLLRAAALAPVVVVNRPLVVVRWQGDSHFLGQWAVYADALQHLLAKHPELTTSRRGLGRIEAQVAFALAAGSQRGASSRWAARALRHDPVQPKAWLALAVAARLVSAGRLTRVARRFGRGF